MHTSRPIAGVQPAAGAEIAFTVPAGCFGTLEALFFSLVTAAAVANRVVQLIIDDGANVIFQAFVQVAQTASQTHSYDAAPNLTTGSGGVAPSLSQTIPIPRIGVRPGYRIRTATTAIQAADQFSAPIVTIGDTGDQG